MPSVSVSAAASHERLDAYRLLFGDAPPLAERDDTGVLVARHADRTAGAILVQQLPGALGLALLPRAETIDMAAALVRAGSDWLRARGVKVCQAFAEVGELPDTVALTRNGFRHITQLVSLRGAVDPAVAGSPSPASRLTFRAEEPPFSHAFRCVLLATHEGMLDCPELNGERTAEELLVGLLEPIPLTEWYLASSGENDVGVAILVAGADRAELSYLGVIPSARRRGVGSELVQFALSRVASAGASALAVSVDARNEPALHLYRRHGFAESERREVFIAQWPAPRDQV